jgi:hypothetical protein
MACPNPIGDLLACTEVSSARRSEKPIAAALGRSAAATALKAHQVGLSLRMSRKGVDRPHQASGNDSEGTISQE